MENFLSEYEIVSDITEDKFSIEYIKSQNIKILEDYNLRVGKSKKKDNYLLNDIVLFYKTKRKGEKECVEVMFSAGEDVLLPEVCVLRYTRGCKTSPLHAPFRFTSTACRFHT